MVKTYSSEPGPQERHEEASCPVCGSGDRSFAFGGKGFRFVRCLSCGAAYQSPRPVFEDLRGRYDSSYFSYELSHEQSFFTLMMLGLRDIRFDEAARGLSPRRFLDVGCATGMLLQEMKGRGWEVQGVDVCRQSAEYGVRTRGVPIHAGTLEEAAFPAASFSTVHFSHLIEHLPDPRAFLLEVSRLLVPGGFAVITTPSIDGFQARLFRGGWRSAIADHLVLFSRASLKRLLAECGYTLVRAITWGGLAEGTAPRPVKAVMDRLAKRLGFGDVMMMLARRDGR